MAEKKFNPLPGFGLTMGYTLVYLSALVLIPIAGLFLKAFQISWHDFWHLISNPRALAAYKLTFGASFIAAFVNAIFGTLLAWILVRYQFFGRRFIDALVDFPFALPTAVAGLTLCSLYGPSGWLGHFLIPLGIKGTYTPLGVVIAQAGCALSFRLSPPPCSPPSSPALRSHSPARSANMAPSALFPATFLIGRKLFPRSSSINWKITKLPTPLPSPPC